MRAGYKLLNGYKKRWQFIRWLEVVLVALGPVILIYVIILKVLPAILFFVALFIGLALLKKPWKTTLEKVSAFIDENLTTAEYSSGLLLNPDENLSNIAKLQQHKITETLQKRLKSLNPPHHLKKASFLLLAFVILSIFASQFDVLSQFQKLETGNSIKSPIIFKAIDSTTNTLEKVPVLTYQSVYIGYPEYTQKKDYRSSKMNIKALEGAKVSWRINFNTPIKSAVLQSMDKNFPMRKTKAGYVFYTVLKESGFYNFQFTSLEGISYTSDLYAIEVIEDKRPKIEVPNLKPFTSFSDEKQKQLTLETIITDDYGVGSAKIIATVTKGKGESVKFREEQLSFENTFVSGSKTVKLRKTINLDSLKMGPGDELYFYVEAKDSKTPVANRSRSETFFAVIKDDETDEFEVEGTMGVDQLPDYFRSQRQLIIDTEKLIKERPNLTDKDFKFRSNELGFDQKALRLKYAEFMGEETDSGIATNQQIEVEEDHDDDHNPLAGYTHDHDSDNEHNLVSEDESKKAKDPLEEYLHNHDDPEESTLFTESLKAKLRKALNEMWDAELHLRVYNPKESLSYQYRALKLIQDIKNSARIYVHRIGFDPPPIKEDKRLSGKIDKVISFKKNEELTEKNAYLYMQEALKRITVLREGDGVLTVKDKLLFEKAGNELAIKAIENPGKYLKTLQQLKQLTEISKTTKNFLAEVQNGLFLALPKLKRSPSRQDASIDEINRLLLKEFEVYD